jgi:hypothetical protein
VPSNCILKRPCARPLAVRLFGLVCLMLQACSAQMLEPHGHGLALRQALQAQRMDKPPAGQSGSAGRSQSPPVAPAAIELKEALDKHLQTRTPASSPAPAAGEAQR